MIYIDDSDFTLHLGDVREVLRELPNESVDCCVTSPPYFGLRDYQVEAQIGLEATPDLYVEAIVGVFREVHRVLAEHGTCFLNLGDSYYAAGWESRRRSEVGAGSFAAEERRSHTGIIDGLKVKDLIGIPWMVAFALRADGWYLRSDIVWAKRNVMPESVTDRPTKAHEYIFLLSKNPHYYFDQEAVREPAAYFGPNGNPDTMNGAANARPGEMAGRAGVKPDVIPGRNIRSVWEIATQPYADAHFATFPEALPRRCIMAGCPERVCRTCGKPSERIVERSPMEIRPSARAAEQGDDVNDRRTATSGTMTKPSETETVGWSDCGHDDWRVGRVLDPFMGSGTTALVARKLGRHAVGIELNEEYAALAAKRLQQLSLFG
jgi:DNA modification methylase